MLRRRTPRRRRTRKVAKVGIVGAGTHIEALTDALVAAGVATVVVDPNVLEDLVGCDLIVDAAGGDASETLELFRRLGTVAGHSAVLATTGASVAVVDCGVASGRGERVVGLRWYVGPDGVRFFELAEAVTTGPAAVATVRALAGLLGVPTATCRDRAGFIVDALLLPYLNDAAAMVEAGYASADDVDAAMTLGCGYPAGPIATADALGPGDCAGWPAADPRGERSARLRAHPADRPPGRRRSCVPRIILMIVAPLGSPSRTQTRHDHGGGARP